MNVSLTLEQEMFIHSQVESGKYTLANDVIHVGLLLLEERERIYKGRFDSLRQEIMIGIEAAERGEVIDGETVFRDLRQKLQQCQTQAGQ